MSSGKLVTRAALGCSADYKNCLKFKDEHNVLYVCGNNVVMYNMDTKEQSFISGTSNPVMGLGITAIATSHYKKVIATAEKTAENAIITFYDSLVLRRKKVINIPEIGSKVIVDMAFSGDGKFFIAQGGAPNYNLCLWNVEKAPKLLYTFPATDHKDNLTVTGVSFCPFDHTVIGTFGKGVGRLLRYGDGQIRHMSMTLRRDSANFISHSWLSDERCIVGTDGGEILLIEHYEFRTVVYPCGNENEDMVPVLSLTATARGFCMGTAHGEIRVFEKAEENKEQYSLQAVYVLPNETSNVLSIALGLDDSVVCLTDSQQIFNCPLYASNALSKERTPHSFDYMITNFHSNNHLNESAIISIDDAIWKPVIATVAKDKTVRIWNLNDNKVENMQKFEEEPIAVALHPSGLYLVVAFIDKLKVLSVLLGEFYWVRDIPIRQCTTISMSTGGNFIAANSASTISIFDVFTGDVVSSLRGHSSKIRSITWMHLDSRIATIGSEGAVYYWDVFPSGKKRPEGFQDPKSSILAGAAYNDRSKVFVSLSDFRLREYVIVPPIDTEVPDEPRELEMNSSISTMIVDDHKRILFAGTDDVNQPNSILSFLTFPQLSPSQERAVLHSGAITCMRMSHDGNFIYSGDSTGMIIVSQLEGTSPSQQLHTKSGGVANFAFVDEILYKKHEYEGKKELIVTLNNTISELIINNEHALRYKEMDHKTKVAQITKESTENMQIEKEKYAKLNQAKMNMDKKFNEEMVSSDSLQEKKLEAMDVKYRSKLNAEYVRQSELREEIVTMQDQWNRENEALVESHQDYIRELTDEYNEKLRREHQIQKKLQQEKVDLTQKFDKMSSTIDDDADIEIEDMKVRYQNRLQTEDETLMNLMSEHQILKKKLQNLNKDAQKQKDENRKNKEREEKMYENMNSLQRDIVNHKKEIRERDDTITDKEKRIYGLKKKNQELEKFRFVLDYKIKELKTQIIPREEEIKDMRKQIEDMDVELAQYHKSNKALNLMISEMKLKLEGMRRELILQTERYEMNARIIEKYRQDLKEIAAPEYRESFAKLKLGMANLYRLYLQDDGDDNPSSPMKASKGEDPQVTYNRDREQLERSLVSLKRAVDVDAKAYKRDKTKLLKENVVLTAQLNEMRKDFTTLSLKQKAIDESKALQNGKTFNDVFDILAVRDPREKYLSPSPSPKRRGNRSGANSAHNSPVPNQAGGIFATEGVEEMKDSPMRSPVRSIGGAASPRTVALQKDGGKRLFDSPTHRGDMAEAWREIQIQNDQMQQLESQLTGLCSLCQVDQSTVFQQINDAVA